MNNDELVSILVPKRHLARIYTFIGSLDAPQVAVPAALGSNGKVDDSVDDHSVWVPKLIERQFRESPDSMKKFQRWLADHPGQEFTTTQMAEALEANRGWNSIAGMLGAYGNRVKNRYKRTTFPFQTRWEGDGGEALHSMTPEVAEIIKQL